MADRASYLCNYFTKMTIGSEYYFKIYSYDSSFLHKVTIKCGNYSKIFDRVKAGVETTFTIPMSWCSAIPNATTLNGTITCQTYKSNYSTKVGSVDVETATFNVPASAKPDIEASIEEAVDGIAEQFGAYVQGKSRIIMNITGTGIYGSTIKNYSSTVNGVTYTKSSYTTGYLKLDVDIDYTYRQWTAEVTDSRGKSEVQVGSYKILSYHNPKINTFSVMRCNADGIEADEGTFVKVTSGASIKPCNDGTSDRNTKTFKLSYKLATDDTWTDIDITGDTYSLEDERVLSDFDINSTYNFKIEATDFFGTTSKIINLESSDNIMDFLADGTGMAIGKAAEHSDTLDIGYTNMFLPAENYMGGKRTSDAEKNLYFTSTGDGVYQHNMKVYGGNGSSEVSLGVYDITNHIRVLAYHQGAKKLLLGDVILSGWQHAITLNMYGTDYTLKESETYETMPFTGQTKAGSKLTLSNNGVLIGAGVTKAKVSGTFEIGVEGGASNKYGSIFLNDSQVHRCYRYADKKSVFSLTPRIISVSEGDLITFRIYGMAGDVLSGSYQTTQLTVEVVE